jgi:hypothetical protein
MRRSCCVQCVFHRECMVRGRIDPLALAILRAHSSRTRPRTSDAQHERMVCFRGHDHRSGLVDSRTLRNRRLNR